MKSMFLTLVAVCGFSSAQANSMPLKCAHAAYQAVLTIVNLNLSAADQKDLELRKVTVEKLEKGLNNENVETYLMTYGFSQGEMKHENNETRIVMRENRGRPSGSCTIKSYEALY